MSNIIHICFCIDDKYVKHCLSTIISIMENCDKNYNLYVNILTDKISEEKEELMKNIIEKSGGKLNIINLDINNLKNIDLGNCNFQALFRLMIPNSIKNTKKVIYLDSDLVALGDISKLWNIDIEDNIIGVAPQEKPENFPIKEGKYFNAGVMIINIQKWLENNVTEKVIEHLKTKGHYGWLEQDALNIVLHNNWFEINSIWNYLNFYERKTNYKEGIIHYAGMKPWRWESVNPYNLYYYNYLLKTGLYTKEDKKKHIWNKILNIIPYKFKIIIDKLYLVVYKQKEKFKFKLKK